MYVLTQFESLMTHKRALLMAYICQILYQSHEPSPKWLNRLGIDIDQIHLGKVKSVPFWVITTDLYQYIVITGTDINRGWWETVKDLSISANILPSMCLDKVNVFHKGYNDIAKTILNELEDGILLTDRRQVVVGHSMGGAIAKILAYYLNDDSVELYTYGTPQVRMGLPIYDTKNHHHYINRGDVVPSFPSSLYWDGVPVYLLGSDDFEITYPERLGIIRPAYRRIREMLKDTEDMGIFHPHAITNYIRHLSEINPDHETTLTSRESDKE